MTALFPKRHRPDGLGRGGIFPNDKDLAVAKTTRTSPSRQPGETIAEWLNRLARRYARSRYPSLRREARQWRRVLRAYRCRTVSA